MTDEFEMRKTLSNYSDTVEFLGFSVVQLALIYSPALILFFLSSRVANGMMATISGLLSLGFFAITTVLIAATPPHLTIKSYFEKKLKQRTQQQIMVHDSNPDDSNIEQPRNDSFAASIARLPWIRDLSFVTPDEGKASCSFIPVERAFTGEKAIQDDTGAVCAAIKIIPANMSTADPDEWAQQVNRLAEILSSSVSYKTMWYSPMRAVDYTDRRQAYIDQGRHYRQIAKNPKQTTDLMADVLSDICAERAGVINAYEDVQLVREYYVIIRVEPDETVVSETSDGGGLENIPGIGHFIKQHRLHKRKNTDEHFKEMIDKLNQRVRIHTEKLNTLNDVEARPLSSEQYSRVLADHFRATNMYAYEDFESLIRQRPVPTSEGDTNDPETEHDWSHVAHADEQTNASASLSDVATQRKRDKENNSDENNPDELENEDVPVSTSDEDEDAWEETLDAEVDGILKVNEDVKADLAMSEEELDRMYKNLLAPEVLDREHTDHLKIGEESISQEQYSATLSIRDWPSNPQHGFLESVLTGTDAGVNVTVATHLDGISERKAKTSIRDTYDALKDKAQRAENSRYPELRFAGQKRQKARDARAILKSLEETEYGLFDTNTYITIKSQEKKTLNENVAKIRSRLREQHCSPKSLKNNHDQGHLTTAPAARNDIHESTRMVGDGLAALLPWTSYNLVEKGGFEIGIHEDRGEPTVVNLFSREHGYNIGLFGGIGMGKTTTLKQLLTRMKQLHSQTQIVVVDPKEEFSGLCQLYDGKRIVIGGDTGINPLLIEQISREKLEQTDGLNPRKDAIRRALSFIRSYYDIMGLSLDDEEKLAVWMEAITKAYEQAGITEKIETHSRESPTFQDVFDIMEDMAKDGSEYVREGLQDDEASVREREKAARKIVNNDIKALDEGIYSHLSGESDVKIGDHEFVYLDLQSYETEGDGETGLMMELLMNEIREQAKVSDDNTIMAMDESHYMLKSASNLETLKQTVRHSRHDDLSLIFSTQTLSEFYSKNKETGRQELTDDASVIIQNMSIRIYHQLEAGEITRGMAEGLGLTETEREIITTRNAGNKSVGRSQALLQVHEEGCFPIEIVMDFKLNPREFALYEYKPSKHGEDLRAYLRELDDVCRWTWTSETSALQTTSTAADHSEDSNPEETTHRQSESTTETEQSQQVATNGDGSSSDSTTTTTPETESLDDTSLQIIDEVGEDIAETLRDADYTTVSAVAAADPVDLAMLDGFGYLIATRMIESAETIQENQKDTETDEIV